jgi:hypothetical protein
VTLTARRRRTLVAAALCLAGPAVLGSALMGAVVLAGKPSVELLLIQETPVVISGCRGMCVVDSREPRRRSPEGVEGVGSRLDRPGTGTGGCASVCVPAPSAEPAAAIR